MNSPQEHPSEQQWDELAAGLIRGADAESMMEHASWCEPCAALLRESIDVFERPAPVEMIPGPQKTKATGKRWLLTAAAIAVSIGAGSLLWYARLSGDPLRQLATVYTHERSIELRLPGAAYGPVRVERGAVLLAERPQELLEAAARVSGKLSQSPGDPVWLHAKGRLAILEWNPEEALKALRASQDLGGTSAVLLVDLAVAYYEKAEKGSTPADLSTALDLLGQALRLTPNEPAALFNRALILERLHQPRTAIEDLEKLLAVEPSGPWSEESRRVLDRVRAQQRSFFERTPGEDAARFDEARLDAILRSGESPARIAADWYDAHGDPWLRELAAVWPQNSQVIGILAQAADIRVSVERGRYERARKSFAEVESQALPAPLAMWREFESLYRATHARGEFSCPADPDRFLKVLGEYRYYWLLVQSLREQSYCSFQRGDLSEAARYAELSEAEARKHLFPVSAARTAALFAHIAVRRGRFREAFRLAYTALESVDQDRLPVSRRHEFLNVFLLTAESNKQWYSALAYAKEMTETARVANFADLQFTSTVACAEMAMRSGDPEQAAMIFRRALQIYRTLAPSDDRAWAEIGLADVTGDESGLAMFGSEMERSSDALLWVPYERVRAKIALSHGRLEEARQRLDLLRKWMLTASEEQSAPWLSEFRNAAQTNLELLLREQKLDDSFGLVQRWRQLEEPVDPLWRNTPGGSLEPCAIFSFAFVGPRLATWRRDGSRTDFRWAAVERKDVERLIRRFDALLRSSESKLTDIRDVGGALERHLFGDWLGAVPRDRGLLIQADETLMNVSFAALPGATEPLGLEHPLSVTHYAIPDDFGSGSGSPPGSTLIIDASRARPAWAADMPALPSAEREVAAIARLSRQADLIRSEDVHASVFKDKLASTDLLYFVGHAVPSTNGVTLVLSSGEPVDGTFDLGHLPFSLPRIVILSACSTGLRTERDVDTGDPESIAAFFLKKGSREVIASLWDVDSEATAELMTAFYGSLEKGMSGNAALSTAMRGLKASAQYRHPHFWAAFAHFIRA